mmetsp:Transcript_99065/g.263249  ORF Transcript_99065/g.263249 Transcript_99065/m.263249 type:complete len:220 (-) Transcript_99065:2-661(-)
MCCQALQSGPHPATLPTGRQDHAPAWPLAAPPRTLRRPRRSAAWRKPPHKQLLRPPAPAAPARWPSGAGRCPRRSPACWRTSSRAQPPARSCACFRRKGAPSSSRRPPPAWSAGSPPARPTGGPSPCGWPPLTWPSQGPAKSASRPFQPSTKPCSCRACPPRCSRGGRCGGRPAGRPAPSGRRPRLPRAPVMLAPALRGPLPRRGRACRRTAERPMASP